jgi:hypothetical protein
MIKFNIVNLLELFFLGIEIQKKINEENDKSILITVKFQNLKFIAYEDIDKNDK